jgi:hypothetical protein
MSPRSVCLPLIACLALSWASPAGGEPPVRQGTKPPEAAVPPRNDAADDPLPHGARARLGSRRFHSDGKVWAVALSPDGKEIRLVREERVEIRFPSRPRNGTSPPNSSFPLGGNTC